MVDSNFKDALNSSLDKGSTANTGHIKPQVHDTSINTAKQTFSTPMTYTQWKDATRVDRKIRSSSLKSFDKAYEKYMSSKTFAAMMEAQLALSCWIRNKNKNGNWKQSIRNQQHGAVEIIYQQLFQGFTTTSNGLPLWLPHLSGVEEQKAMAFWVEQSQQLCKRYFTPADGSKLHLQLNKSNTAKAAMKELKNFAGLAKKPNTPNMKGFTLPDINAPKLGKLPSINLPNVAIPNVNIPQVNLPNMDLPNVNLPQLHAPSVNLPGMNMPNFNFPNAPQILIALKNLIANFFGFESFLHMGNFFGEIMGLIAFEFELLFGEFMLDMIPGIAQLKDGAGLLVAWGKTAYSYYSVRKAKNHGIFFNTGDASKAFDAVHNLMKRETKALAASASTITARFTADALTAGASTQASGIAKNIAAVIQRLFLLGLQWREAQVVNKVLKGEEPLSFEIFKLAPITGSYLVAHGQLSDLLSMGRYQFGSKNWQDVVMELDKKHIQPMRKTAKKQIKGSLYKIPNFPLTAIA